MIDFIPSKAKGLILGLILLIVALGASIFGLIQLASAAVGPWLVLWVALPTIGFPLALMVGYQLYGLLTACYKLDRDGFYLAWGLVREQIPLASIVELIPLPDLGRKIKPGLGLQWPGCIIGHVEDEALGEIEFFATKGYEGMLLISSQERRLVISPPDLEAFQQAFVNVNQLGSLERIRAMSQRPVFISTRLWADRIARTLLLSGLILPLLLLSYISFIAQSLPDQVPFGFNSEGMPGPLVPPGRLMFLPLAGGFCWMIDFIVGVWFYRREREQVLAYTIWAVAVLVGGLFWGAALYLLKAQ